VATLAPLVMSLVIAVALSSPLALLMGILAPALVAATWWQSLRNHRKARIARERDYEQQWDAYRRELEAARELERDRAMRALPSVDQWLSDPLCRREAGTMVRVGTGPWSPPAHHPLAGAGSIFGMPAAVDASEGLALVAGPEGRAVWRTLYVQWLIASGPAGIDPPVGPPGGDIPTDIRGLSRAVWVGQISEVPDECRTILVIGGQQHASIYQPGQPPRSIRPDTLSHAHVQRALGRLAPSIEAVEEPRPGSARGGLVARLSPDSALIDLVREGPHAVIWGATGSGKSVAACSLVGSLAERYSPHELVCVLVDFKGGAGLRPLRGLPHTVGIVTDLERSRSERARIGLEAEMVTRERILADNGVSDSRDLPEGVACPRLIVVVDEVAWLCDVSPAWAHTIADIARRGRSLGLHLVLSTQRITGVLSRAVMANVTLRICARVSDEAELTEWMPGVVPGQRAAMSYLEPGRVLVSGAHSAPGWHRVSHGVPEAPTAHSAATWRVWSEALPTRVTPSPGVWGLRDTPETHDHAPARDNPLLEGSTIIIGDRRSGKTNTARVLAELCGEVCQVGPEPALVWLALRSGHAGTVLLIDDADVILHSAGPEGHAFLLDAVEGFAGRLLMTVGASSRLARHLARLAPHRVVLSVRDTDDRHVWDAPAVAQPGLARFRGTDVQVVYPGGEIPLWQPARTPTTAAGQIVLTLEPQKWQEDEGVQCFTPDQLHAAWLGVADQFGSAPVIVDGVDHREARSATGGRVVLPPLAPPEGMCWMWRRAGVELVTPAGLRR